jgi:hypothetical protein
VKLGTVYEVARGEVEEEAIEGNNLGVCLEKL